MPDKALRRIIGIMIGTSQNQPPMASEQFFAHLCKLGARWGYCVVVFSPLNIDFKSSTMQGFCYQSSTWIKGCFPLPDLIYDRAFHSSYSHYSQHTTAINKLLEHKRIPYLGQTLRGKRSVHNVLLRHPILAKHLPKTELFRPQTRLLSWLKRYKQVVLKPETGSHGRGILIIGLREDSQFNLSGRSMQNEPFVELFPNLLALKQWIQTFIGKRTYLIQQYLLLKTVQGNAYDVRVLMQKGSKGAWIQTGMAARVGQPGSVTSNLHGGGKGMTLAPLLTQQFNAEQAELIISTISQLSALIPTTLEDHFGRLAELGLDMGIDQSGSVWIIEVNSKPGRAVARWFSHPSAENQAMSNPLHYARYLLH